MKQQQTVGIIGAGQLGKMLAEAMQEMDISSVLYDSQSGACGRSAGSFIHRPFDDMDGLDELIDASGIVTCEFENVPRTSLEYIEKKSSLLPRANAFALASHRMREKEMFTDLAIPCADYKAVKSLADLEQACESLGTPLVLKTCSGGYDGKGQAVIQPGDDLATVYEAFIGLACIAEQWIDYSEEVSCILVRSLSGEIRMYPVVRNWHQQGILRLSIPQENYPMQQLAEDYAQRIAAFLDYVGVLTLECFLTPDGRLLGNEIAPRVHNSGHWSIEGAVTSQFSNHIRAILDMPLGATDMVKPSAMINLLGCMPDVRSDSDTWIHAYGKQIKPKRKVGHITLLADTQTQLLKEVEKIYSGIYGGLLNLR